MKKMKRIHLKPKGPELVSGPTAGAATTTVSVGQK